MISHVNITASQKTYDIDPDLAKYIQKKIGKLDRHMKRANRAEARADVKLRESTGKGGKRCSCEAILHIPGAGAKLTASESSVNMYASVDIVEKKLQNQLKKMKEKHSTADDKHKKPTSSSWFGQNLFSLTEEMRYTIS